MDERRWERGGDCGRFVACANDFWGRIVLQTDGQLKTVKDTVDTKMYMHYVEVNVPKN